MKEPQLFPYKTKFEVVSAALENGLYARHKSSGVIYLVIKVNDNTVFCNDFTYTFKEFSEKFIWLNGKPCGVLN